MKMLNNKQIKVIDVGIAEMVSFVSQGKATFVCTEKMMNIQTCTASFGKKILKQ